jgi:hypothetical protein
MNNTPWLFRLMLITLLALTAPCVCAGDEEISNGVLYEVTWTDIDPDLEFVLKGDTFRLLFTSKDGRKVELKPMPPLRGRWGQDKKFKAVLSVDPNNKWLYCGEFVVKKAEHPKADTHAHSDSAENSFVHPLSISVIDPNFVILDFQECKWHENHGGLAHAHTWD